MVASGGTAVRFRPASSDEVSSLPACERPRQDLDATIADGIRIQQPFVEVTGENTGDVVASRNVRVPPNTDGYSVRIPETIDSGGTYDVVVRTADETALATRSITVVEPDIVANLSDATRDDDGPGSYTYPTGDAFRSGAFDLNALFVEQTRESYLFRFEVGSLYDAMDRRNGFSPHAFVLWVADPDAGGGRWTAREDLGANVEFRRPWHYRIAVSGSGANVIDAEGDSVAEGVDLTVDLEADRVGVRLDRSALGGADANGFGVVAAVHAADEEALLPVETGATDSTFGGAQDGATENAPRITDLLTEFATPQSEALAYDAEDRATLPFVPLGDSLPEPPERPADTGQPTTPEATTTEEDTDDDGNVTGDE